MKKNINFRDLSLINKIFVILLIIADFMIKIGFLVVAFYCPDIMILRVITFVSIIISFYDPMYSYVFSDKAVTSNE